MTDSDVKNNKINSQIVSVARVTVRGLLGLVYAGLVVLVLGVEAGLEVVDERGRHQLAHHLRAVRHQQRARVRGRRGGAAAARLAGAGRRQRRGRGAAPAPLRDLALDVERAALGAAGATRPTL